MNHDKRRINMIINEIPDSATTILDVGCVRHDTSHRKRGNLHNKIHKHYPNAHIVGVDLPGKEVDIMRNNGYAVLGIDCQEMNIGLQFDAIIAGELIEHLPNPGLFIDKAKQHLNENAPLILSTPNPDCLYYNAIATRGLWTSAEHTCWIDPKQLETLCNMYNMRIVDVEWVPWNKLSKQLPYKRLHASNYIAKVQ